MTAFILATVEHSVTVAAVYAIRWPFSIFRLWKNAVTAECWMLNADISIISLANPLWFQFNESTFHANIVEASKRANHHLTKLIKFRVVNEFENLSIIYEWNEAFVNVH